ncbi:hypothetical protein [Staphylococcus massiliensis]|uniref:hypothetical protein n=1 Tax=Staphylococcus massiliensis TaxID=555791 RepID=UPI001EE0ED0D|nr:hypothetical protein [Staphylococcus massiliensis]MCG3398604.1 hypothetical protein [Staphylococcus massiliensis]
MAIFELPNYLWISALSVIVLNLFCIIALKKWIVSAVISFLVLGLLAFVIPNFYDITFEPLLGYAAFMGIFSLVLNFLIWFFTKDYRRKRREKKLRKELAKYETEDEKIDEPWTK